VRPYIKTNSNWKVKLALEKAVKERGNGVDVYTLSLTSALDGVGDQRHACRNTPGNDPVSHCTVS